MAKRKRSPKKRRARTLSSGGAKRRTPKKRRRGLSEGGTKGKLVTGIKHTLAAMAGGGAGVVLNKMIPASMGKMGRLGLTFVVGIGSAFVGAPIMGAGLIGAMTANTFPNGFLNDDADFADDDVLNDDQPLFLDDDGNPMVLEENSDGSTSYRYLNDEELALMEREGAFDSYTEL